MKCISVISLGSIGMRHANNLKKLGCRVLAYDSDADKMIQFGSVRTWADLFGTDGVVIASPTHLHNEHLAAIQDMSSDCPIFIEKPIADKLPVNITDVEMVGYNLRYHSCVKKAKEWMNNGMVGRPLWANFTLGQYSEKPPYLRDGVILNWSHEIDLALYLLGPWSITGSATRISDGRDDLVDILLNQSGCRTSIHLDYLTKPEVRQSIIVGDEATIIMDLVHRVAWLRGKDDVMLDMHEGKDSWNDNYIEEMQEFLDVLDDPDIPRIGATGAEGLEVLKICTEVRKQAGL